MNSEEMYHWLNKILAPSLDITFSCSVRICSEKTLPLRLNGLYICNINGKHWIVLMQRENSCLHYFDPLGNVNMKLLSKYSQNGTLISLVKLQDYGTYDCGYYCLLYTILRLKFKLTMFASNYHLLLHKNNLSQFTLLKSCVKSFMQKAKSSC